MDFFSTMGGCSVAIGLVMLLFRKPFSKFFCGFGRWSMKGNFLFDQEMIESFYSETRFENVFPKLGAILILQGVVLLLIGYFIS